MVSTAQPSQQNAGGLPSSRVQLRRPVLARLFSSALQTLLTVYALAVSGMVVAAVSGKLDWSYWPLYLVDLAAVAVWLLGVSAWADADDGGVRWRYWMKQDIAWQDVTRVALGQRAVVQYRPGPDRKQPAILVSSRGDEDFIRPAAMCGRHRRDFGTPLLALAAQHGKRTAVTGRHWSEAATADEAPYA